LGIAQRLYLDALISYPRTSSQKLPPIIDYKKILNALSRKPAYKKLASKLLEKKELKPREGAKEDPAHPAVYPTGKLPKRKLSEPEKRVWDLVVKRFMAVFGETAIKQSVKVCLEVNGHSFFLRGRQTLKEGWMQFYKPYVIAEEVLLPQIKEGETIRLKRVICDDKFTNPPPRYNPSSLLKKMEELGIGTKATRADIIETLYNRRYIADERIVITELGFDVIDILNKYAPGVISVKLTQELEKKMERIQSNNEKRENILLEAVEQLKPQLEQFKEKEEPVGEALSNAIKRARMQERIIGKCPTCGTGTLMILYSRKTKKRFIGCTNYFKGICKTSFPLPQRGTAKPMGKNCSSCGWPLVRVQIRGRRPWRLCFNPDCPLKEERRKRFDVQNLQ
jgi:DNA topoisomerase-1